MGPTLLHVSEKKHRSNTWIQGILWLLFFKGALLKDADSILIQQTENVQAARQIRFTHVEKWFKWNPS